MSLRRSGWMTGTMLVNFPSAVAHAATRADTAVDLSALLRLTLALGVVLAAILALTWLLRRVGRLSRSANGQLRILGGLPVGNRERIVLVQVGKTQLLLGVAPGQVQTLHILEETIDTSQQSSTVEEGRGVSFAHRLRTILDDHGKR